MGNVMLGKVCKAMYKLSGKTLTQLSDETDITVDTINNLFYARIQKPGFDGVCKLVNAMGFRVTDLTEFLKIGETLPETADITDEFTKYIFSVKDTESIANAAKDSVKVTEIAEISEKYSEKIEEISKNYEEKLEKYKEAQLNYVTQIQERYKDQIQKMDEAENRLVERYELSLNEIKEDSRRDIERQDNALKNIQTNNRLLALLALVLIISNFITILVLK